MEQLPSFAPSGNALGCNTETGFLDARDECTDRLEVSQENVIQIVAYLCPLGILNNNEN